VADSRHVLPPPPLEVLTYSMRVIVHHLFGVSSLNRNTRAGSLKQDLVAKCHPSSVLQWMARKIRFAFDFSLSLQELQF
jgi:hypothetical protein